MTSKKSASDDRAFANALYAHQSHEEMQAQSAATRAALASDALAFARKRKRGAAALRVFNPTVKANGWETPRSVLQVANDDMPFLVDSITNALNERGIAVHTLLHPVLNNESFIHV